MTYRMRIKDLTVECDTAEEAAALLESYSRPQLEHVIARHRAAIPDAREQEDQFEELLKMLGESPRNVLRALSQSPESLDTDSLAAAVRIPSSRVKYIIRSIQSATQKLGIKTEDVLLRERRFVDRKLRTSYSLSPSVRDLLSRIRAK